MGMRHRIGCPDPLLTLRSDLESAVTESFATLAARDAPDPGLARRRISIFRLKPPSLFIATTGYSATARSYGQSGRRGRHTPANLTAVDSFGREASRMPADTWAAARLKVCLARRYGSMKAKILIRADVALDSPFRKTSNMMARVHTWRSVAPLLGEAEHLARQRQYAVRRPGRS